MTMTEPKDEVIVVWFLQENSDTSISITTDLPSNCKRKITQKLATQPKNKDIRDMFKQIEEYNKKHDEEKESIDKNEKHEESYLIEIY